MSKLSKDLVAYLILVGVLISAVSYPSHVAGIFGTTTNMALVILAVGFLLYSKRARKAIDV